ncbi:MULTISPECIES: hypothetical protein [unclassified Methanoregula]|uniref:hypothetical protein n=1 Tax=unclassified Methanoregula TaxID=2649730 RepID=UPI0009D4CB31|nr:MULTISPECIES: hypothetical protein [unclassified Methanoregula]OPX63621.1 MAG: hypothetical protein A4E33_01556 [Methanoregula sp. PtaB.Bin085]OPY36213.1 MAG: hypothetical protein A4E34_00391 [Methanoregula sp. PtaU1.Bin006]
MEQGEAGASFWESLYRPHPVIFALLVFLGLDLEFVVHYWFGITIVYTQFFYLIIVSAASGTGGGQSGSRSSSAASMSW